MRRDLFNFNVICKIFNITANKNTFYSKAERGEIPRPMTESRGKVSARMWRLEHLPPIGKEYGFLKDSKGENYLQSLPCAVVTSYTKKGGVLKSTLAFNFARISALHGIKTCIIGLDSQCDISRILGHYSDIDEMEDLKEIQLALDSKKGLINFFKGELPLEGLIYPTSIPTLFYIPETDAIEELTEQLESANRREYWLEENVISKLKSQFDLIILDCSPTSGRLVANAIFSSDLIISPLECSINNFRNYKSFEKYLRTLTRKLQRPDISVVHIPTKLNTKQNLSRDIFNWYVENISECTKCAIKLSSAMEDSIYSGISIIEHDPTAPISEEVRTIMIDIYEALTKAIKEKIVHEHAFLEQKIRENISYQKALAQQVDAQH